MAFGEASELPEAVDVLIVGAGPAGLACADLLGLNGVRTLLVEQNEQPSALPKAILIDDEFHRLFATTGAAASLERHFVREVGVTFYSPLGFPLVEVAGFVTPNGFPNRSAFHQPTLETDLRAHIATWPSVTAAYGHRLIGLAETGDAVAARIERPDGTIETIRARYAIGADGAHSTVRAAAGIGFEGGTIDQPHVVLDIANDPDQAHFSRFWCDPRRPRNSVPAPYGGRRYEFMLLPGEDPARILEPASLARLVRPIRPLEDLHIVRQAVYFFHRKLVTRMSRGRLFLVGDAAHQMPPFGAQGMNAGGKDAANLCWKLAFVLSGQAGPGLLDTYHAERHAHARAIIDLSVRIGRLTNLRAWPLALLRDLGFGAARLIPAARRWFAAQRYLPRQRYRAGFVLDPPAAADRASLVGRMMPGPTVEAPDGVAGHLDRWLGFDFALVAIDVTPAIVPSGAVWRRAVRVILCTGDRWPEAPGWLTLRVRDGRLDEAARRHRGQILVVRPDRYVAAAVPPADLDAALDRLGRLLDLPALIAAPTPIPVPA